MSVTTKASRQTVSSPHWTSWRKLRKALLPLVLIVGMGVVALTYLHFASTPSGVYHDPDYGAIGGADYEFKSGQIWLRTQSSYEYVDVYCKSDDQWFSNNGQFVLRPSVLGIKIIDTSNAVPTRWLYRRQVARFIDSLDWLVP